VTSDSIDSSSSPTARLASDRLGMFLTIFRDGYGARWRSLQAKLLARCGDPRRPSAQSPRSRLGRPGGQRFGVRVSGVVRSACRVRDGRHRSTDRPTKSSAS
jgi:hypothetical protein